jgi:hypothetical protein
MSDKGTLIINANVDITADALQAVVENSKKIAGPGEDGVFHIDTADMVADMISRFLSEKDFESYVMDLGNYPKLAD